MISTNKLYFSHISIIYHGSDGLIVKVSTSKPQDREFLNPTWLTTMIPHMTPVLVPPESGLQEADLESDLNKL